MTGFDPSRLPDEVASVGLSLLEDLGLLEIEKSISGTGTTVIMLTSISILLFYLF